MRKQIVWVFSLVLFVPSFSFAQNTHPNRSAVVAQAKTDLAATGHTFQSACGAFSIVELATWRMRDEGAGLLDKPGGNNCRGFAVDIIAYPDGAIFDVLINAETENIPAWQVPGAGVVDPSRYRLAHNPELDTAPPVPPSPPVPPTLPGEQSSLDRIEIKLDTLTIKMDTMALSLEEHRKVSRSLYDKALGFFKDPRTITMILGVLAGRFVLPNED